jgi:hypothetical protein
MAHIWIREPGLNNPGSKEAQEGWAVLPLDCDAVGLAPLPPRRLQEGQEGAAEALRDGVGLFRRVREGRESWTLLSGRGRTVSINGFPLPGGIRVLDDRDEIRIDEAGTLFFSTEVQARIELFPGGDGPVHCARCKNGIEPGTPAARCPRCDIWHHESEDTPCWRYSVSCAMCDQPTDLEAGFRFTPEDL